MRSLPAGATATLTVFLAIACGSASEDGLLGGGSSEEGGATSASGGAPGSGDAGNGGLTAAGGVQISAGGALPVPPGFRCRATADCAPYAKVCETVFGNCVDCLSSAQCTNGGECRAGVCEAPSPVGSGGAPGAGGAATGAGGADIGAGGADIGAGGADTGAGGSVAVGDPNAWVRCSSSNQCTNGRICTATLQEFTDPGRPGACVKTCGTLSGSANCDPLPPGGGEVTCVSIPLIGGLCTITCGEGDSCPLGLECAGTFCYNSTLPQND